MTEAAGAIFLLQERIVFAERLLTALRLVSFPLLSICMGVKGLLILCLHIVDAISTDTDSTATVGSDKHRLRAARGYLGDKGNYLSSTSN